MKMENLHEYTYYKIIFTDTKTATENRLFWDYDRLIEEIERLEREGRRYVVNKYTETLLGGK